MVTKIGKVRKCKEKTVQHSRVILPTYKYRNRTIACLVAICGKVLKVIFNRTYPRPIYRIIPLLSYIDIHRNSKNSSQFYEKR